MRLEINVHDDRKGPAEKGRALCSVVFLQKKMTGRHGRFY